MLRIFELKRKNLNTIQPNYFLMLSLLYFYHTSIQLLRFSMGRKLTISQIVHHNIFNFYNGENYIGNKLCPELEYNSARLGNASLSSFRADICSLPIFVPLEHLTSLTQVQYTSFVSRLFLLTENIGAICQRSVFCVVDCQQQGDPFFDFLLSYVIFTFFVCVHFTSCVHSTSFIHQTFITFPTL